jgi:hypothetical protein
VLYVITVHWRSDRWVDPQLRYLHRFAPGAQVWASLDGTTADGFDRTFEFGDTWHGRKLDGMAAEVVARAEPSDRMLFLDGDAFPIAPLAPLLESSDELIAVRRAENRGELQPHPSFALMTVRLWREVGGSWRGGPVRGDTRDTDAGGKLLAQLDGRPWHELLRVNRVDLDALSFGVYGDETFGPVVYHHGAGFRPRVDRLDRVPSPAVVAESVPVLGRAERAIRYRWAQHRWHDRILDRRRAATDAQVRDWIASDDNIVDRFV